MVAIEKLDAAYDKLDLAIGAWRRGQSWILFPTLSGAGTCAGRCGWSKRLPDETTVHLRAGYCGVSAPPSSGQQLARLEAACSWGGPFRLGSIGFVRCGQLPPNRHACLAGSALVAPQCAVEARTSQVPEYCRVNVDRMAAAIARYTRDFATLGHGEK
jgi:hypothetical protein